MKHLIVALLCLPLLAAAATAPGTGLRLSPEMQSEQQGLQAIAGLATVVTAESAERLGAFLVDRSPTVRRAAFVALRQRQPDQLKPLVQRQLNSGDAKQRGAACLLAPSALGVDAVPLLIKALGDISRDVRWAAANGLRAAPCPREGPQRAAWYAALDSMLTGELRLRRLAVDKIATLDSSDMARRILVTLLRGQFEEIADHACTKLIALGELPDALTEAMAKQLNADSEPRNRIIAAGVLQRLATDRAVDVLLAGLPAQSGQKLGEARAAIADALGTINTTNVKLMAKVEKAMLAQLDDSDYGARLAAAWTLGRLGSKQVVHVVVTRLGKRDHQHLAAMLRGWTGQTFEKQSDWNAWFARSGRGIAPTAGGVLPERSNITFYSLAAEVGSVVYVLDTSGSMLEQFPSNLAYAKMAEIPSKIQSAKRELWRSVSMLNPKNRLALVFFDTEVRPWKEGTLSAGWRARWKLWVEMESRDASGATNTSGSLQAALEQTGCDTGFFLTDGMPTNGDILDPIHITSEITARNLEREQPLALHTIAFLVPEAEWFLTGLAKLNQGTYELQR